MKLSNRELLKIAFEKSGPDIPLKQNKAICCGMFHTAL